MKEQFLLPKQIRTSPRGALPTIRQGLQTQLFALIRKARAPEAEENLPALSQKNRYTAVRQKAIDCIDKLGARS